MIGVGDEVTMVRDHPWVPAGLQKPVGGPVFGAVYVVAGVERDAHGDFLQFAEWPEEGFWAPSFRKIQKWNLQAWLETGGEIEEPKRAPAVEVA